MFRRLVHACLTAAVVSACSAAGPVDNPIGRTLTWFSYVGGEDIRKQCEAGGPNRWRFVYNGDYQQQVRTYDMVDDRIEPGAILESRASNASNLVGVNLRDPLSAWQPQYDRRLLSPEQRAAVLNALTQSGFAGPAPKGELLRSDAYYWVVSACQNGQFHLNAWQQPGKDLSKLAFVPVLLDLDRTGVAYNRPRDLQLGPFYGSNQAAEGREVRFQLQVAENGLNVGPRF